MNFNKKAVSFAVSLLLASQVSFAVFADNSSYDDPQDGGVSVSSESESDLSAEENDPTYQKIRENAVLESMMNAEKGTIYGQNSLVHNSKFANYDKNYGIDVSYYQGNIDWNKVKAAGIKYAIIRVGYRGYGDGSLVQDSKLYANLNGAKAAGIKVGVYFYTQAINTNEAKQEANFVLNKIKGYDMDLPIYYDIESVDYDTGRLDSQNLSKAEKTNLCKAFCDTIKANGYETGVYANKYWLTTQIDGAALAKSYHIWLAHYTNQTDYNPDLYEMWQYTGKGNVDGISGYVDMNVWYTPKNSGTSNPNKSKKVQNLTKSDTAQTKVMLKWDKVKDASGYAVYVKNSSGEYELKGTTTTNAYTVTGLKMATVYKFNVRPYFNSDSSTDLNKKSVLGAYTTDYVEGTKTTKAANLRVTKNTSNSISVKWDEATGRVDGYQVAFYDENKHKAVEYVDDIRYVYTKLWNGNKLSSATDYKISVRPYYIENGVKYPGVYADVVTTSTTPSQVNGLKLSGFYEDRIKLSWNSVSGATSYKIYQVKNGSNVFVKEATGISVYIDGAKDNTNYTYCVKAVRKSDATGRILAGPYSSNLSVTYKTSAPTSVKVSNIKSTSASVSWTKQTGATGYQIYLYDSSSKKYKLAQTVSASSSSASLSNMKSNSSYKVKVRAAYGAKCSDYSSEISFKTAK